MKKILLSGVMVLALMATAACGGGGGGSSPDLSCAPADPSTSNDFSATYTFTITNFIGTCATKPTSITCTGAQLIQDGTSVTLSGSSCDAVVEGESVVGNGGSVTITSYAGIVSGDYIYWAGSLAASIPILEYSETDTIDCETTDFTASTIQSTVSYTSSHNGADPNPCTGTATATWN